MPTGVTPVTPEAVGCLCLLALQRHRRARSKYSVHAYPGQSKHVPSFKDREPWLKIHKERNPYPGRSDQRHPEGYSPQDKNQASRGTFTHRKRAFNCQLHDHGCH